MMRPSKAQSTSMDFEIGSSATEKSSTKYAHNKFTGHSNDGRLVQMSQQPNRKGNDGTCHHSGMSQSGKTPPTSALPSVPAQGSVRDNINRGTQHRGGGTAMPTCGRTEYNMGRGPTRGNQQ
jgi:hypothetical protein